jgi:hypothetical protein
MMKNWEWKAISALVLLAVIPTSALAESSNAVFLSCDTTRHYDGSDGGKVMPEKLYFKIDLTNSKVTEFNADLGKYEVLCGTRTGDWKLSEPQGVCSVGDELVTVGSTKLLLAATSSRTLAIYRSSGRITGSQRLYFGVIPEVIDQLGKPTLVKYDIRGTCQQGPDMSLKKKAF